MQAAKTFDWSKKIKFTTWVYRPIYWNMLKYINKQQRHDNLIKLIKENI